jgi:excisionase family DNA binding protein
LIWFLQLASCTASSSGAAMTDKEIKYLTVEELSRRSGLSTSTLHRLKKADKIPFFQPAGKGGRLLFPADAIEQAARLDQPESEYQRPSAAESPKRLSGQLPKWMQPPTSNNPE